MVVTRSSFLGGLPAHSWVWWVDGEKGWGGGTPCEALGYLQMHLLIS